MRCFFCKQFPQIVEKELWPKQIEKKLTGIYASFADCVLPHTFTTEWRTAKQVHPPTIRCTRLVRPTGVKLTVFQLNYRDATHSFGNRYLLISDKTHHWVLVSLLKLITTFQVIAGYRIRYYLYPTEILNFLLFQQEVIQEISVPGTVYPSLCVTITITHRGVFFQEMRSEWEKKYLYPSDSTQRSQG